MVEDFFSGFAGHAHTKNDLVADPNSSMKLRKENSVEEAQRLTNSVLGKIEKEISKSGYDLNDVKLLVLYLSYRGENEEKDKLIMNPQKTKQDEKRRKKTQPTPKPQPKTKNQPKPQKNPPSQTPPSKHKPEQTKYKLNFKP